MFLNTDVTEQMLTAKLFWQKLAGLPTELMFRMFYVKIKIDVLEGDVKSVRNQKSNLFTFSDYILYFSQLHLH